MNKLQAFLYKFGFANFKWFRGRVGGTWYYGHSSGGRSLRWHSRHAVSEPSCLVVHEVEHAPEKRLSLYR